MFCVCRWMESKIPESAFKMLLGWRPLLLLALSCTSHPAAPPTCCWVGTRGGWSAAPQRPGLLESWAWLTASACLKMNRRTTHHFWSDSTTQTQTVSWSQRPLLLVLWPASSIAQESGQVFHPSSYCLVPSIGSCHWNCNGINSICSS